MFGRSRSGISGLLACTRSLWRGVRRRAAIESDMDDEFRHHLELRTEALLRSGLSRREAARRARNEFGGIESHKDAARAARGLRVFDDIRFSSMDVKLGLRMLARYPGLTIVAGLTMAFAIGVGAGLFEVIRQLVDPTLPLPESDRIVVVQYHDRAAGGKQDPHAYDVLRWRGGAGCGDGCADPLSGTGRRDGLASFEAIGAFLGIERNLSIDGGVAEPIEVAEISASAFRTTRTPALLGRTLVDSDEAPGAPPVVVLGYGVWQTRLDGDNAALGRDVRIGDARMTVVGVMPKGFGFPVHHEAWVPLQLDALPKEPGGDPALSVFGRLAPGVTLAEAEAELSVRMAGAISEFPEHYEHLTPAVVRYAAKQGSISPDEVLARASVYSINLVAVAFLVLMCGNVALLMFARAATRERELLVRNALGAGRARIVTQLFVEALVLGAFAAALGLAAAGLTVRVTLGSIIGPTDRWPFWLHASLSPATIVYATGLAILASVIAGVIPALKVTGRDLETRLRAATAGAGGLRMGGIWNGIVRTQIAATVVFVAITYPVQRYAEQLAGTPLGFAADEYVAVRLEMDPANPMEMETDSGQAAFLQRYTSRVEELKRRIAADPAVAGVTVAAELPLMEQRLRLVEVDGARDQPRYRLGGEWVSHHPISMAAVDLDFFDAFGAPILAGRGFDSRDLEQPARTVIVNEAFVRRVLGGRNAVGQRIRQPRPEEQDPEPWYEIVGVVPDLVLDDESPLDLDGSIVLKSTSRWAGRERGRTRSTSPVTRAVMRPRSRRSSLGSLTR